MSPRITKRHGTAAALPETKFFGISEIAAIYQTTAAAIRTALWRRRKHGVDPRIPLPIAGKGHLRWLRSAVQRHLDELQTVDHRHQAGEGSDRPGIEPADQNAITPTETSLQT